MTTPMPDAATTAVKLCCPTHHDRLIERDGRLVCARDGETFPVIDGIPVLIADRLERERAAGADWSAAATESSALDFYNKIDGQDAYLLSELTDVRQQVERGLAASKATGPVLEIGSGKGVLQGVGGSDYVALDYSFTALRQYIKPHHQRVCATAERLPFSDDRFRFIFTNTALEHVPNADLAFDEIHRVLKPGGVAYVHPAWHCTQYNCEGIPVRPYRDLTLRQKWVKLTLPIRQRGLIKAAGALPKRALRRLGWRLGGAGPTKMRFHRLRPDYQTFWMSDSDAASRLDSHEGCLYFQSRGYEVLSPDATTLGQLLCRHQAVVVRKPH